METIIHIGQHKTGTTSLQHFLLNNKIELERRGVFFPKVILGFENPSHYILNVYALDKVRSSSMKDSILKAKGEEYLEHLYQTLPTGVEEIYQEAKDKKCSRIIWSNEGLYLLNSIHEYQKLLKLFTPFSSKIIVVCCFRDLESYKSSYTSQLVSQGITSSTDPHSYRYVEEDSWLYDYERKKIILAEVFDQCFYFRYQKKDNITPFLKLLNIEIEVDGKYRLNVTSSK